MRPFLISIYTVYAISSINRNYIYVGITFNLEERLVRHNSGYEKTTKPYAPFKLIFTEQSATKDAARIREKYWKSGIGKSELKRMIN